MENDNSGTNPKWMIWTGRVISTVVVLMLTFSAIMKFMRSAEVTEEFTRLGWLGSHAVTLGILEIVCTALYALPQTAVLGAILLTGYLGGATATHVRIADPFLGPVIGGVLVWLGLYLRDPRIRQLVPWKNS